MIGGLNASGHLAIFVVVLAIGFAWRQVEKRASSRKDGVLVEILPLRVGEEFRSALYLVEDGRRQSTSSACTVLIVIDPSCAGCAELAARMQSQRRRNALDVVTWVSTAPRAATRAFGERYAIRIENLRVVASSLGEYSSERLARLGIPMVPLTVALDEEGRVWDRQYSMDPPDPEFLLPPACTGRES